MYDEARPLLFQLPDEAREIQRTVAALSARHQDPLEARMLAGETLTRADYRPGREAAKSAGLWGLGLPAELGGADLPLLHRLAATEQAMRCVAPLEFGGAVFPALLTSNAAVKAKYLTRALNDDLVVAFAQTEAGGGADPGAAIRTRAVMRDGRWVINGAKTFISRVAAADVIFVVAVTDAEKRQRGGISLFAVDPDNPGLRIGRRIPVLGGREVHELYFDDCAVDADMMLGGEGAGFRNAQIALSAARFSVGVRSLGIAQRAYEMMVAHAKTRESFGGPLSEKQAVQAMIVDSWIEIEQVRLLAWQAAEKADHGHDVRMEAGMIKMLGTELSARVLDRAIQVHGAAGVALDGPLAYFYAEQRPSRIYEGPSEVHKHHVMARRLLA